MRLSSYLTGAGTVARDERRLHTFGDDTDASGFWQDAVSETSAIPIQKWHTHRGTPPITGTHEPGREEVSVYLNVQLRARAAHGAKRREPLLERVLRGNNLDAALEDEYMRPRCERIYSKKSRGAYWMQEQVPLLSSLRIRTGGRDDM